MERTTKHNLPMQSYVYYIEKYWIDALPKGEGIQP